MKRNLRPRPAGQYVKQQEWELEAQDEDDFILGRRYNVFEKFHDLEYQVDHGFVKEMQGEEFNMKYIQETGFSLPMVFRNATGLGMRMPPPNLTVMDIKKFVGSRRKVDVIDALTQESTSMSLGQWTRYYETFPRQRILNIISLEISCTKLDSLIEAPELVRQLDWVERVWPKELKKMQLDPTNDINTMKYPKVQKYCLMSVAGCYTDFHLDFGGTSVWYHVLKGEKQFLLIPPSTETYSLFQHWQMSGEQEGVFLAELMDKAQFIHLHAGDTFIMPSGWIHAVYTPADSIVFGGNFLHSFNIAQQLTVADLEKDTKVPSKQKYPFYGSIHWYVLQRYTQELRKLVVRKQSRSASEDSEYRGPSKSVAESTCSNEREQLHQISSLKEDEKPVTSTAQVQSNGDSLALSPHEDSVFEDSAPSSLINEKTEQEEKEEDTSLSKNPHFSSYERGGLLLLVQKMKNNAFHNDIPYPFPLAHNLLAELDQLLQTAMSPRTCSPVPSGVGVLTSPSDPEEVPRKITRKRSSSRSTSPGCSKHVKMEDETVDSCKDPPTVADTSLAHMTNTNLLPLSFSVLPHPQTSLSLHSSQLPSTDITASQIHSNHNRQLSSVSALRASSPVLMDYKSSEVPITKMSNPVLSNIPNTH